MAKHIHIHFLRNNHFFFPFGAGLRSQGNTNSIPYSFL